MYLATFWSGPTWPASSRGSSLGSVLLNQSFQSIFSVLGKKLDFLRSEVAAILDLRLQCWVLMLNINTVTATLTPLPWQVIAQGG